MGGQIHLCTFLFYKVAPITSGVNFSVGRETRSLCSLLWSLTTVEGSGNTSYLKRFPPFIANTLGCCIILPYHYTTQTHGNAASSLSWKLLADWHLWLSTSLDLSYLALVFPELSFAARSFRTVICPFVLIMNHRLSYEKRNLEGKMTRYMGDNVSLSPLEIWV